MIKRAMVFAALCVAAACASTAASAHVGVGVYLGAKRLDDAKRVVGTSASPLSSGFQPAICWRKITRKNVSVESPA